MTSGMRQTLDTTNRRGCIRSFATTLCAGGLAATLVERQLVQPVSASKEDIGNRVLSDSDAEPDEVFPQSVMSGGPAPSGALVWTRIDPDAYKSGQALVIEVSETVDFDSIVYHGEVSSEHISPEHDFTVAVDIDSHLDADRFYRYRFTYSRVRSRTGRLRTMPTPEQKLEELSLAVQTCQNYQSRDYPVRSSHYQ